ncbi:MAG: hypothetical protein Q8O98_00775, partial [bacterium]|nr:hypothetical protein [bacterium]
SLPSYFSPFDVIWQKEHNQRREKFQTSPAGNRHKAMVNFFLTVGVIIFIIFLLWVRRHIKTLINALRKTYSKDMADLIKKYNELGDRLDPSGLSKSNGQGEAPDTERTC